MIAFDEADIRVRSAGRNYHHVELDGADADVTASREGEPQLPIVVRFFLLPPGTTVDSVAVRVLDELTLPERVRPVPIQPPESDEYPEVPPWEVDRSYPSVRSFVIKAGDQRTYRMAKVAYSPLTYDARTEQLTLTTMADITVSLREMSATERRRGTVLERPETRDGAWGELRAIIRSKVVNGDDLDAWYPLSIPNTSRDPKDLALSQSNPYATFVSQWPSVEGQNVNAIIITNNVDESGRAIGNMEETIQPYATELTEWGFTTVVRTVDDIAAEYLAFDRTASVRDFIADAVRQWGTYFVILAGDESVVPTRRLGGPDQVDQDPPIHPSWRRPDPPTDFWYTRVGPDWEEFWNLDGDEWIGSDGDDVGATEFGSHGFSSVYVGRLPARTWWEMDAMVAKLGKYRNIGYHAYFPGNAFLKSALVAAGPTNSSDFDGDNGTWVSERYVAEPLEDESPWTVQREYPDLHRNVKYGNCECYGTLADSIDVWVSAGGVDYWEGDDLFDQIDYGYHVVFHIDHSDVDRLGRPSVVDPRELECGGWDDDDQEACRKEMNAKLRVDIDPFTIPQVRGLTNNPPGFEMRASFMFSMGSWTTAHDRESIAEALMRFQHGGAVAFIGKTATCCGMPYNALSRTIDKAFVSEDDFVPIGIALMDGIDASYTGEDPFDDIRPAVELALLGDPSIVPWRSRPVPLSIDSSPSSITALGVQTISVAVEDSLGSPVENALVCVRQGQSTYATSRTDAAGTALFKGIAFQDTADVELSAWRPQYAVAETTLAVSVATAHVVYVSHEIDDSSGGDDDGVLEPGETADVIVQFKNRGTATSASLTGAMRPTPAVLLALKIDGEYRAGSTFLGSKAANPSPEQDLLRIPLTRAGVRLEGAPSLSGNPNERFEIYREHSNGLYKLVTVSPSQSADTVFTGTIVARGGLSSVQSTIDGSDQVIATADSIWFSLKGDATPDIVTFAAEAPEWITLGTTTGSLGSLAPADSATAVFSVTALEDLPDEQDLVFTASTYTGFSNTKTYSDFAVTTVRSTIDLAHIEREFGDFGCADTTWKWTPGVWNAGSADADSVVLILRVLAGSMTVQDSVVVLEDVGVRQLISGDSWLLCGESIADTAGLEVEIALELYHNGERTMTVIAAPGSGSGGCEECASTISGLRAELQDGGVMLRWNASEICELVHYHIGRQPTKGPIEWFAVVGSETTQFFIHDINGVPLEPQGPDGYPSYEFVVRSVLCTQTLDVLSTGDTVYTWAKEREGWPIQLPARSRCAPMVVDLSEFGHEDVSGIAIFAATDRIHAFREDGTSLDPEAQNGDFFDPDLKGHPFSRGFATEVAVGDWNTDVGVDGPEIVGNLFPEGVYMVSIVPNEKNECCEAELVWMKDLTEAGLGLTAPGSVIAKVLEKEGEPDMPVVFLAGTEDSYVYAWEGNGAGDPYGDGNGRLYNAESATYNYRSLAIGFRTPDPKEPKDQGEYELVHSTRDGKVHVVPLSVSNPGAQVNERDTWDSETGEFLSTPAVGDVDGDGSNEIVVTSRDGSIWVIDENTMSEDASDQDEAWLFSGEGDNPAAGPSLADLDDDGDLEILALTRAPGGDGVFDFDTKYTHTLLVFDYDAGNLNVSAAMDSVPFSQRTFNSSGVIGSVVIGDHDSFLSPPQPLWDIYGATNAGAIFKFGVNPNGLVAFAQAGWPLVLGETSREPVLAVLDPTEPSQASLVVQGEDGWLHVFDLGRQDDEREVALQWPSAGFDGGNTRGRLSFGESRSYPEPDIAELRLAAIRTGDIGRTFVMEATRPTRVELDVFDMSGRHVRQVFDGQVPVGSTELRWDGRLSSGEAAPSGVYAFRVRGAERTFTGKVVVLK